jgi:hypothetical protein
MKYAGGFDFATSRLRDDYLFHDTTFHDLPLDFNVYDSWFGRSFVLPGNDDRRNLYITARYNRAVFYDRPEISERLRYDFHNRDIFLLGLGHTRQQYRKSRYIHGFGPTEDIPLGSRLQTIAGYEMNQFNTRWYAGIDISHSSYIDRVAYFVTRYPWEASLMTGISSRESLILRLQAFQPF